MELEGDIFTLEQHNMEKKRKIIIAVLLIITIGNFVRLKGNENIRTIQFLAVLPEPLQASATVGGVASPLVAPMVQLIAAKL